MTQPAVTRQLAGLEKKIGTPLFTRHSRGVHLTAAGELLMGEARLLLAHTDALMTGLRSDSVRLEQTLRVACPREALTPMTHVVVAAYQAAHPNIKVELVPVHASSPTSPTGFEAVADFAGRNDAEFDVALWLTDSAPETLEPFHVLSDPVVVLASTRAELPDIATVDEVLARPFVDPGEALSFIDHLYLSDFRNGARPRLAQSHVDCRFQFWRSVIEDRAVACVPKSSTDFSSLPYAHLLDLREIELAEPVLSHSGVLVRRDEHQQHVRNFGHIVTAVADQLQGKTTGLDIPIGSAEAR